MQTPDYKAHADAMAAAIEEGGRVGFGTAIGAAYAYRAATKPRTITVNGIEVPEPVREALRRGSHYYLPSLQFDSSVAESWWDGGVVDRHRLAAGLIHLTREAAQQHIDAMLAPSRQAVGS